MDKVTICVNVIRLGKIDLHEGHDFALRGDTRGDDMGDSLVMAVMVTYVAVLGEVYLL